MKNVCIMGKLIENFIFINCPVVKKTSCRFAIDNNFFPSTYWTARYFFIWRNSEAPCTFLSLILRIGLFTMNHIFHYRVSPMISFTLSAYWPAIENELSPQWRFNVEILTLEFLKGNNIQLNASQEESFSN